MVLLAKIRIKSYQMKVLKRLLEDTRNKMITYKLKKNVCNYV